MLRKFIALISLLMMGAAVNAAGWVDQALDWSPGKIYLQGWACDPGQPQATGWAHFTVNGQFVSALPANQERPDLQSVCGSTAHGYSGWVDVPANVGASITNGSDYKKKDVYVTLVMDNFSPNVDAGVAENVKIWSPYYFEFAYATWAECTPGAVDYFWDNAGYAFTRTSMNSLVSCSNPAGGSYQILRKNYVNIMDPAIPKGAKVTVCDSPNIDSKLATHGWSITSRYITSTDCVFHLKAL